MNFTSRSQAGQDLLTAHILGYKRDGTFFEVGCSEPIELSNSYALETELGWRGVMLDISPDSIERCIAQRKSRAVLANAVTFDFRPELLNSPRVIDLLSFDVDESQVPALENFLRAVDETKTVFRVLTVETDLYRFGPFPKARIVELLKARGYDLVADDVMSNGCPYETFWVKPELVDMKVVEPFRSSGLDYADVLKKGGAL